ncbi:MAG: RNA polymerase sigma factor [Planctomycetota bacterium]|jgi:RNA polymerase sigma-70 factor (ECF subfamily)
MIKNEEHIQQLLSEAGSGSRTSMGHLATIVWERLYPFVFRTTLNPDATEDILQETLLTVVQQVSSLRESRRFWPWVYRIAWSKIQNNLKRCRLQSSGNASLLWNQSYNGQAGKDNILEAKIHEETLQQVSDGIEQLSRQHRDILRLRYYEQLPYREIASLTRTTPEMARVRFYRAKKCLKARMLSCCV